MIDSYKLFWCCHFNLRQSYFCQTLEYYVPSLYETLAAKSCMGVGVIGRSATISSPSPSSSLRSISSSSHSSICNKIHCHSFGNAINLPTACRKLRWRCYFVSVLCPIKRDFILGILCACHRQVIDSRTTVHCWV